MALLIGSAHAASVSYHLDTPKESSDPTPNATLGAGQGWLSATFTDVAGGVQLKLSADHLSQGGSGKAAHNEFVSKWFFNVSGPINNFQYSIIDMVGKLEVDDVDLDYDDHGAAGYSFDLAFEFGTSNSGGGSKRFGVGESVTFLLSGTLKNTGEALSIADFMIGSTKKNGLEFYSMAHVQGLADGKSTWIGNELMVQSTAVPEASTWGAMIGVAGLAGLTLRRRFARRS